MMKINIAILLAFCSFFSYAQSESLTSSPYSLYGLGVINQSSIGKVNGMGYTGIAMKPNGYINNLNPASYALIPQNNFLFDIGGKAEINNYANKNNSENNSSFNFSNIALAFPINQKMGMGFTLIPYSQVGYSIIGLETNIEGSTEVFESNILGSGGLNEFTGNFGFSVSPRISVGFNASVLFGNIQEEENFTISSAAFGLEEETSYRGVQVGFGTQIDVLKNVTLGATVKLPTTLKGSLERSTYKTLDYNSTTVESDVEDDAADFDLPLQFGLGISSRLFNEQLLINADYRKSFWDATNQTDHIGTYTDQNSYGIGFEYQNNNRNNSYLKRIAYRTGINYDDGYLQINDDKISGYSFTGGLGLPISNRNNSTLNISYSYGTKGFVKNILVKENYHLITINVNLQDFWFVKHFVN
ncbi:OmpP1/FadL family transporter [Joostella sp. CR20]|uniref:OmpP1/FadL family transporter n=1 Tax=Joostella sp. CR20 TaxID=2804312 RepID=UPI00313EF1B1